MTGGAKPVEVVLVEDSHADYRAAERMLRRFQPTARLERFETGEDLLNELPKRSVTDWWPRLIVLDVNLSGKTGVEVLKELKSSPWARVPVIVLSGSAHVRELIQSYNLGAGGFLTKPTGLDDLHSTWGAIVQYWLVAVKPPPPPTAEGELR